MKRRVIVLDPQFPNLDRIEQFRARFDPIALEIPPHITLVFPFESDIETGELNRHIAVATSGMKPFEVVLSGVTSESGEYLFLNVTRGGDQIIELHDRLYLGPLAGFLRTDLAFVPHLTVGRLTQQNLFGPALAKAREELGASFTAILKTVTVFEGWPEKLRYREIEHVLS